MGIRQLIIAMIVLVAFFSITAQTQSRTEQAVLLAKDHFRSNARSYGLSNPDRELAVRTVRDRGNQVVVRFDQLYRDVAVFEGEAIARVSAAGVDVTNALRANLSINTQPGILNSQAVSTAVRSIGLRGLPTTTSSALRILPQGQRSGRDVLVWHVHVEVENDADPVGSWEYFVDAKTGAIVWSFDSLKTQAAAATATGKTMYSGDVTLDVTLDGGVYSLVHPTPGTPGNRTNDAKKVTNRLLTVFTSTVPSFGNNNPDNGDNNTAGADAHFGMYTTWSFYQTTFGRNGVDDTGRKAMQRVHYSTNWENASWSEYCFCMTYGDGATRFYPFVSLDIAGHEMTHGVTASEANMTYFGESGGLNESTSDIFGSMVEFFANNAQDVPDYWIGEMIFRSNYSGGVFTPTKALRYMDHPSIDGTSNCWFPTIGYLEVHLASGPNNHMFYLLSHGGTSFCNGQVVAGIGNDKASRIWYKALTDFMTQSTNYHQARTAALNAATALYGNGSAEYNATNVAFAAINVN